MAEAMSDVSSGRGRGVSFRRRRPYLQELLQGGRRRTLNSKQSNERTSSVSTPTENDPVLLQRQDGGVAEVKHGELLKTSRSKVTDKVHGPPRRRRFRLTEQSLEYFQPFSQV